MELSSVLQWDVVGIVRAGTGQVVARYSYDAWGNCTVTNASGFSVGRDNPFRYRGYYYDAETGFYYLNSRYYNPEWGRFISADVFVSTGQGLTGANMFAYCGNNPVMCADSSGAFFFTALGAVTGFIGSATVSLLQGNDISTAINDGVAGAVGGAIAGAGVDAGLVIVGTGGAAAPFVAAGVTYLAGGVGNLVTTRIASEGKASADELTSSFIIGGTFNIISFGTSFSCASKTLKGVAIKGYLGATENSVVGTCTALSSSIATHIGTTIAKEGNRKSENKWRLMVQ